MRVADQVTRVRVPIIAVALAALGCAVHEVPLAPRPVDMAAKAFMTAPGQAWVYVYRMGSILDLNYFTIGVTVVDRDRHLGYLGRKDYLEVELSPGHHYLSATIRNEKTSVVYPDGAGVQLDVAADRVYFVRVEARRLWPVYPPTVRVMDEVQGKQEIDDCRLINFFPTR
jgi:hypothetical protein